MEKMYLIKFVPEEISKLASNISKDLKVKVFSSKTKRNI